MSNTSKKVGFYLSLASAFALIAFGVVWFGSIAVPVVKASLFPPEDHYNLLPQATSWQDSLKEQREKSVARQPYPELETLDPIPNTGNWIHISSLDIHVPLVLSASLNEPDIITALDSGAVLYPNGVLPGNLGNTFVAGHSTANPWQGTYRFAFMHLNNLAVGNYIHLDFNGTRYSYRMVEKNIVTPSPANVIVSDRPVPSLTLMTCWPIWSTEKRLLITGELTHITKLTPTPS